MFENGSNMSWMIKTIHSHDPDNDFGAYLRHSDHYEKSSRNTPLEKIRETGGIQREFWRYHEVNHTFLVIQFQIGTHIHVE